MILREIKNCDVCSNEVKLDKYGNGKCKFCGWERSQICLEHPDNINPPNFVSLNKAKQLYANGEKFKPSYFEVISLVSRGLDISFKYKGKRYQLDLHDCYTVWEVDTKNYKEFKTLEEFRDYLDIEGELLKDIWDRVNYIRYEC